MTINSKKIKAAIQDCDAAREIALQIGKEATATDNVSEYFAHKIAKQCAVLAHTLALSTLLHEDGGEDTIDITMNLVAVQAKICRQQFISEGEDD